MKTQRNSWVLAILATGLLLGYIGANLFQFPPLHGADQPKSSRGGLPVTNERLIALENRLLAIELLVQPFVSTETGMKVVGSFAVEDPGGTQSVELLSPGNPTLQVKGDVVVSNEDGDRFVELLRPENALISAVAYADGEEMSFTVDKVGLETRVSKQDGATTLWLGRDEFYVRREQNTSENPLAEIGFDSDRAIIAILRPTPDGDGSSIVQVDPTQAIIAILRPDPTGNTSTELCVKGDGIVAESCGDGKSVKFEVDPTQFIIGILRENPLDWTELRVTEGELWFDGATSYFEDIEAGTVTLDQLNYRNQTP